MHVETDGTLTFSHTSLSLWRLCRRRWWQRYVMHEKETAGIAAAWSVHMVHRPIELTGLARPASEEEWTQCYLAFGLDWDGDEDNLHTVGNGRRLHGALRSTPPCLADMVSEQTFYIPLTGHSRYSSRPDIVGHRQGWRFTVDYKYSEKKWRTKGKSPWPLKGLLPYDDQLLGQAIAAKADGFMRGTIAICPETQAIYGPIFEERLVDGQCRKAWLSETVATVLEIEAAMTSGIFAKNPASCYAFGRTCPFLRDCSYGT